MLRYVLKRLIWIIPVVIGVSFIVFFATRLAPGDPAQLLLGPYATEETLQQTREELGLDKPMIYQYGYWASKLLQGDFGDSIVHRQAVLPLLLSKLGSTLILGLAALIISIPLGLILGLISAIRQNSWLDKTIMLFSFAGISMPVFWLGMLLIILFSLVLGWLPSSGMYSAAAGNFTDLLTHLILPAVCLALVPVSVICRMMRTAMLEVIQQDYIRTAKAKGCSPFRVVMVHALKNCMVPIVTIIGIEVGYVIGGAVVVETVFAWPGIGQLLLNSILTRDYPLIIGGSILLAVIFALINLIVDVLYVVLDPKIELK